MKYIYAYKTGDGARHEASMEAESREAAFAELRRRGIRAIKVAAADGSKANGEVRGVRKRVVAAAAVAAALLAVAVTALFLRRPGLPAASAFDSRMRRQIIGDAAVIDKGVRTGWADVFVLEGERYLASYAIPGATPGVAAASEQAVLAALEHEITVYDDETLEARQIKSMVLGMKDELRRYREAGGSVAAYGKRLVKRQQEEMRYYLLAKRELEMAQKSRMPAREFDALWEKRNGQLRNLGIKLIPLPE